jgi:hypothetical protein
MKRINWSTQKSQFLKELRGFCFEDLVFHIDKGDLVDDYLRPKQQKCSGQRIMVIGFNDDAYPVPYVENDEGLFLRTMIPSRKAHEKYLGVDHESKTVKRRKRNS